MQSCLYEGRVIHHRHQPSPHHFEYRLFMALLDLGELPLLLSRGLLSASRIASASFLSSDHRMTRASLREEIQTVVKEETGIAPNGPIRLLTQLRYFGYYFSPLNLYYCMDDSDGSVEAIVAEVSNTPWRERHRYVLWDGNRIGDDCGLRFSHRKAFHVSPFMDMEGDYRWSLSSPADHLDISIQTTRDSTPFFAASMALARRPLTRGQLVRMSLRYPIMTGQITGAIYWQALKLWWKKCPYYSHPKKQQTLTTPAV